MTASLFFRLLQVQVAIVAMGSVNAIVDGIVAARFIDAETVGVVGLYYPMMRVLEATGSILLGGVSVLSGRYLGSGRIDRIRGVCSLGLLCALLIGGVLTAFSLFAPGTMADLMGSNAALRAPLIAYITGYGFGIIPLFLAQQLASMLQMERQERRGSAGILLMIALNVALDILFVTVMNLGEWLILPDDFGSAEKLVVELRGLEDVTHTAQMVQSFCAGHGITERKSASAGLCLEEMAGNIVRHGFHADRREHVVELRVIIQSHGVTLRIKDDCIPSNPREWHDITNSDDPTANIGIRLVFRLADEVECQSLLGLNVLAVCLSDAAEQADGVG